MEDGTPEFGSTAGDALQFESAPDPLLNIPVSPFMPDLYGPGPLDSYRQEAAQFGRLDQFTRAHRRLEDWVSESSEAGIGGRYLRGIFPAFSLGDDFDAGSPADAHARHIEEAMRAHPAGKGRKQAAPLPSLGDTPRGPAAKLVAVLLALLLGGLGAHNLYLRMPQRAMVNIGLGFTGSFLFATTGQPFTLLPLLALVLVECWQILTSRGAYREL